MRSTHPLIIVLVLFAQALFADTVYKGTDANGHTIYSDQPIENGKKIEIIVPPSYQLPPVSGQHTEIVKKEEIIDYHISIVEPADQQTIGNEITSIEIKVSVEPKLQNKAKIRLVINGQPFGEPTISSTFVLNHLPRGSYSIYAEIFNTDLPNKGIAKSQTITIYQQRAIAKGDVSGLAPQAPQAPRAP